MASAAAHAPPVSSSLDDDEPRIVEEIDDDDSAEKTGSNNNNNDRNQADGSAAGSSKAAAGGKHNRLEKKSRKALSRLGWTQVTGINKVSFRKARDVQLNVGNPDVYKVNSADCYVVFGVAQMEEAPKAGLPNMSDLFDMRTFAKGAAAVAAEDAAAAVAAGDASGAPSTSSNAAAPGSGSADGNADDGAIDVEGLDPKEISLVMAQSGCTKAKAVAALREHGDVVEAIMAVSSS